MGLSEPGTQERPGPGGHLEIRRRTEVWASFPTGLPSSQADGGGAGRAEPLDWPRSTCAASPPAAGAGPGQGQGQKKQPAQGAQALSPFSRPHLHAGFPWGHFRHPGRRSPGEPRMPSPYPLRLPGDHETKSRVDPKTAPAFRPAGASSPLVDTLRRSKRMSCLLGPPFPPGQRKSNLRASFCEMPGQGRRRPRLCRPHQRLFVATDEDHWIFM